MLDVKQERCARTTLVLALLSACAGCANSPMQMAKASQASESIAEFDGVFTAAMECTSLTPSMPDANDLTFQSKHGPVVRYNPYKFAKAAIEASLALTALANNSGARRSISVTDAVLVEHDLYPDGLGYYWPRVTVEVSAMHGNNMKAKYVGSWRGDSFAPGWTSARTAEQLSRAANMAFYHALQQALQDADSECATE